MHKFDAFIAYRHAPWSIDQYDIIFVLATKRAIFASVAHLVPFPFTSAIVPSSSAFRNRSTLSFNASAPKCSCALKRRCGYSSSKCSCPHFPSSGIPRRNSSRQNGQKSREGSNGCVLRKFSFYGLNTNASHGFRTYRTGLFLRRSASNCRVAKFRKFANIHEIIGLNPLSGDDYAHSNILDKKFRGVDFVGVSKRSHGNRTLLSPDGPQEDHNHNYLANDNNKERRWVEARIIEHSKKPLEFHA